MTRGMNGEQVLKFEDVLVGYVPGDSYGYKRCLPVTVSVRMERLDQRPYQTTAHDMIENPLDFSITTAVWKPNRSDWVSGGATVEPLNEILAADKPRFAPGWDAGKIRALLKLAPWHLNAVTAGCDHVTPVMERDRYDRVVPSLDLTPPCPKTGYRYGHAWLVRVLPDGFEQGVRDLFPGGE